MYRTTDGFNDFLSVVSIAGRTQSREPDIFCACGRVEETLFPPYFRRRRKYGGKRRQRTALPKAKRRVEQTTAYVLYSILLNMYLSMPGGGIA